VRTWWPRKRAGFQDINSRNIHVPCCNRFGSCSERSSSRLASFCYPVNRHFTLWFSKGGNFKTRRGVNGNSERYTQFCDGGGADLSEPMLVCLASARGQYPFDDLTFILTATDPSQGDELIIPHSHDADWNLFRTSLMGKYSFTHGIRCRLIPRPLYAAKLQRPSRAQ
jgi:hypothetical protein